MTSFEAANPRVDQTLAKGLRVLETLADAQAGMGVTEVARTLDLSKSNAFRLLRTLTVLGYVRATPKRRYEATLKAWQVGLRTVDNLDLGAAAAPHLRALSQATGEAVYLAVPDGITVVYLDKLDSTKPVRSWTPRGGSAPMHCVGTGKALLAANYPVLREQVRGHLDRFTPHTLTDMEALDADVQATLDRGFAFDRGEYRERVLSFGAVARIANGEAVAALGVSVPEVNVEPAQHAWLGELVRDIAAAFSQSLRAL